MKRKSFLVLATATGLAWTLSNGQAGAQSAGVFSAGFLSPTKLIFSPSGSLIVAESGNGPNTGRISLVNRDGNRRTLLANLPAGFSAPNGDPSGPSDVVLIGRQLYILIGGGDAVISGPTPGTELPNPNPSSKLFSSILTVRLDREIDLIEGSFVLSVDQQQSLAAGQPVGLTSTSGEKARVRLLVNFPDFTPEPRPNLPENVRSSNPFGLALNLGKLYIADASQNTVQEVNLVTGESRLVITFANRPNPTPVGPPQIEAVPSGIRAFAGRLLVPQLTGFPFPSGFAQVLSVGTTGDSYTFIEGLTMAIDVLPRTLTSLYTLEFSTDPLNGGPGRLQLFTFPGPTSQVLAADLITPAGMARDEVTGDLFVTSFATGTIVRVPVL